MDPRASSPNLADLTEDILSCILSFLRPIHISVCACVCRRLREICKEEHKVWLPMCERRWGSFTQVMQWGGGCISFKLLYGILVRWENLIGFWRGVGNGHCGSLALFDWASRCIIGYKIVPAASGCYAVQKFPFLWMSISNDGQTVCFLDPAFKLPGKFLDGKEAGPSSMMRRGRTMPLTNSARRTLTSNDFLFANLEDAVDMGLLLVDVHFVGNHHLVIEDIAQQSSLSVNELAEAAAVAAFGSSQTLGDLSRVSLVKSPSTSGSETDSYVGSPPGSLQYEMYQFLLSKVISSGGERAARKQKKRDKERAWSKGKCILEPEHFVKVSYTSPTEARPLQGLWKGHFDPIGLDFVLITYDEQGGIVCRKVHDLAGTTKSGSVLWTSDLSRKVGTPLPLPEEALYTSRTHIQPSFSLLKQGGIEDGPLCEEVTGMLCTSSCDLQSLSASNKREGRIWQYASGNFGFGFLHTDSVIDFRVICSNESLLDVVE